MEEKKNPVGRPLIVFGEEEWDQIDKMCAIHCTATEIAGVMGISIDTLESRIKETHGGSFPEYFAQKSASGRMSLRRKQFTTAVNDGNPTMLIWLGKNWLNQKDKLEHSGNDEAPLTLNYKLDIIDDENCE